ncbi:hypothetical protein [Kistimonas asteriae]|uniref:hypothetical protein n=1 Tax=Kistimonas asteriae TaxID=517724 RepID=UPI001BA6F65F|nr:hypothetical protein [Kistimonas asteriae]
MKLTYLDVLRNDLLRSVAMYRKEQEACKGTDAEQVIKIHADARACVLELVNTLRQEEIEEGNP